MDITEKIFNIFFSKCIPIYLGPSDTNRYFNKDCYIDVNNNNNNLEIEVQKYINNEELFNEKVKSKK